MQTTGRAVLVWLAARGNMGLWAGLVLMGLAAAGRWPYELERALLRAGGPGPDLALRYVEVQSWFAGQPVYGELPSTYPPATFPILWLTIGWTDLDTAHWVWTGANLFLLAALAWLLVRESLARTRLERAFLALFCFSASGPLITLGNGQLTIFVLAWLVAAFVVLKGRPSGARTLLATVCMLLALAKPNLTAPFFWAFAFVAPSLSPAAAVVVGYAGLTLFASWFQPVGLTALFQGWLATSRERMFDLAYSDLPVWLGALGLRAWIFPASLGLLCWLGLWVYRNRHADLWLLLGVSAIVARVWATHRLYDDMLLFLPMVALFRTVQQAEAWNRRASLAAALFAALWLAQLVPATWLILPSTQLAYRVAQTAVWLAALAFLLQSAAPAGVGRGRARQKAPGL